MLSRDTTFSENIYLCHRLSGGNGIETNIDIHSIEPSGFDLIEPSRLRVLGDPRLTFVSPRKKRAVD